MSDEVKITEVNQKSDVVIKDVDETMTNKDGTEKVIKTVKASEIELPQTGINVLEKDLSIVPVIVFSITLLVLIVRKGMKYERKTR